MSGDLLTPLVNTRGPQDEIEEVGSFTECMKKGTVTQLMR